MNEATAAPDAPVPGLPAALRDAVRRVGVAPQAVRIARGAAVTWRDGSLGCPQPGMAYTQALVRGWQVFVEAGGSVLRYHASAAGTRWLHCDAARAQEPLGDDAAR